MQQLPLRRCPKLKRQLLTWPDGAIENLLSTFHNQLGYYSSAMVYYAIAPGAFLSPVIISRLGSQLAMGIGALTCKRKDATESRI